MSNEKFDIESTTNLRVKKWVSLSSRRERERTGTFLIEGRRETERAVSHLGITEVIWAPELCDRKPTDELPLTSVSLRVFEKLSRRQNPDGVAAVAKKPDLSLDSFNDSLPSLVLVADGVEKPGNIGAMLRTCDAFGAAFIGSSLGTDIVNPNVVRAAQGSLYTTLVADVGRFEAIEWCRENTTIISAHPTSNFTIWERDLTEPVSLIIGVEHSGLSEEWLAAGVTASIPMAGVADSLNASVSAGIILSEALRQRAL